MISVRRLPGLYEDPSMFMRFLKDTSGATAIEYGLIAGLIAIAVISAVTKLGTSVSSKFNKVATSLT
ncbi:MAG: Flp family type IVb pilin [Hyphomicrobiales bacterium]|nr:Flp family type IVb pilin [Hyphomicrobiales bacterium]